MKKMDRKEIIDTINGADYDFLRKDKKLGENIILLTLGGSHAYGTNIDTPIHKSDIDLRGIRANTPDELLSMSIDDKPYSLNDELDVSIYPFKQTIHLLKRCNPNLLEILGTREEDIFICNKYGNYLRDNYDIFLSKPQAYVSFGGYATEQLRRLQNALVKGVYNQSNKEEHIKKSLERKMSSFEDRYSLFNENDSIKLSVKDSNKSNMDKEIYIDISLSNYPIRDFKGICDEFFGIIRNFDKLNHRNSKKDELHLLKHSMCLIKLLIMGTEILSGEGINTYRHNDRKFLLDIRNGKYSFEEIFEMTEKYESEFEYARKHSILPQEPDYKKIDEFVQTVNFEYMKDFVSSSFNGIILPDKNINTIGINKNVLS